MFVVLRTPNCPDRLHWQMAKPNLTLQQLGLKTYTVPPELFTTENLAKTQEFWYKVAGFIR